jgi:(1->4)-alpha-D-glucan 1-alpha-D-glucosylmutase
MHTHFIIATISPPSEHARPDLPPSRPERTARITENAAVRAQPLATYRVQMRAEFDFAAAAGIVPYLHRLGVSHLYCSPYMQAAPHSAHGYDVVDPTKISGELGGEAGLRVLDAALDDAQMGQLLDIVPNHMCVSDRGNRWWWDVLRSGRQSPYAAMFDIDWDAPALLGRVLLPVLRDPLVDVLERGELRVVDAADGFELDYGDTRFPIAAGTATSTGLATVQLLDAQHFVLAQWQVAGALVNYRRFFDQSSLAGLCVDKPAVFCAVLSRALELVDHGVVDGLRVDHVDGLRAPGDFLARLRSEAPSTWIVAEKILAMDERLPLAWPIDGTTGYEFGALVSTLFVHPPGLSALDDCYRQFTGDQLGFAAHSHRARLDVLHKLLEAELGRLARTATAAGIAGARTELAELLCALPVYRLYPRAGDPLGADDQIALDVAADGARGTGRCDAARLSALVDALRNDDGQSVAHADLRDRFQQVAGAVMAKGVEDTAFYRYLRLVALNDVGADPERTTSIDAFHEFCTRTAASNPLTLLTTTTHDTKRAEDARLRVALLAEIPELWTTTVAHLHGLAKPYLGGRAPTPQAEYLFYQTLVAAHPIDAERLCAYMLKASREAKQETSWIEPDASYEAELERFVREMAVDPEVNREIDALIGAMTPGWQELSLSQTLLKLTAPGVPDIYQGSELWDLRLVDPDNRTPVDYELRGRLFRDAMEGTGDGFMSRLDEGLPKLRLIATALAVRGRHAGAFTAGSGYQPLPAHGSRADHAICFSRIGANGESGTVTVAFRWPLLLGWEWHDTAVLLPAGPWRNGLTGEDVQGGEQPLAALLREAPIALLERA